MSFVATDERLFSAVLELITIGVGVRDKGARVGVAPDEPFGATDVGLFIATDVRLLGYAGGRVGDAPGGLFGESDEGLFGAGLELVTMDAAVGDTGARVGEIAGPADVDLFGARHGSKCR